MRLAKRNDRLRWMMPDPCTLRVNLRITPRAFSFGLRVTSAFIIGLHYIIVRYFGQDFLSMLLLSHEIKISK